MTSTPAQPLALTRAQRRGVPVLVKDHTARIASASDPCGARSALGRLASMAGIMAAACHRRKWYGASHHWRSTVEIANTINMANDLPGTATAQAEIAERATYRAANESGESGGRARSRRRKQRPPPDG